MRLIVWLVLIIYIAVRVMLYFSRQASEAQAGDRELDRWARPRKPRRTRPGWFKFESTDPDDKASRLLVPHPRTGEIVAYSSSSQQSKLERLGLPVMRTLGDIAVEMGVIPARLWGLIQEDFNHYYRFEISKRRGGVREILAPKSRLKEAQRWILRNILDKLPFSDSVHGFRAGRSVLTNASEHLGREVVAKIDLKDFFPSIRLRRVIGLFRWMGYSREVSMVLGRLCTHKGSVPQGAPTSPAIANLVCLKLDRRMRGLAKKFQCNYTRYADDMTFSGDGEFRRSLRRFIPLIRKIVREEGFKYAREKTHIVRKGGRQVVTGVVVNEKPGLDRRRLNQFRAIVHNCARNGFAAENRDSDPKFKAHLLGFASYVKMICPEKGERFVQQLSGAPD